jgi:hypothetical protein
MDKPKIWRVYDRKQKTNKAVKKTNVKEYSLRWYIRGILRGERVRLNEILLGQRIYIIRKVVTLTYISVSELCSRSS